MGGDDFHELAEHRQALMALWDAAKISIDSAHHRLREVVLQASLQFHDRHPEHSITTIRKTLTAWLGLQPDQLTDRADRPGRRPFTTPVKIAATDGTLTIYVVSTESNLQNPANPHEHWAFGVIADGQNSQEDIQSIAIAGSFGEAS